MTKGGEADGRLRNGRIDRALVALVAALVLALLTAMAAPAAAQGEPAGADRTLEDLRALVSTLEDEAQRQRLLADLRALLAAREQAGAAEEPKSLGEQLIDVSAGAAARTRETMGELADYFGDWPVLFAWLQREIRDPAARARGVDEALSFLAIFAAGWLAEFVLWRLLSGSRRRLDDGAARPGLARLPRVVARFLLDLAPLAGFAAAAHATALVVEPTRVVQAVGLNFVYAYLTSRALMATARLLLSPSSSTLRLLPLADATAADLFRWVRRFVHIAVGGYFVIAGLILLGLPRRGAGALLTILGLLLSLVAVAFVVRHRRTLAGWLRRRSARVPAGFGFAAALRGLAATWHVLAIGYIVGFYVVAAFGIEGGFDAMLRGTLLSIGVGLLTWLLLLAVSKLLIRMSAPAAGTPVSLTLRRRLGFYLPAVGFLLRAGVVTLAVVLLLEAWNVQAFTWLQGQVGRRIVGGSASILLVLAAAVLIWEVASSAIERYLTDPHRAGTPAERSARVRTLLPLLRKALFVALTVMVALIVFSEIGIDIAPLLAGAGVIGLAIGFGAQKLVQDVITGVFMLVEDAIAIGDVVNVAGVGGQVEDLSIRSIRLRDLAGAVHTVPFSSVGTVTNLTKDFSYYVFDIAIAYREDPDEIGRVCREIVEEMRADPAFGPDILEPLEVFGVDAFGDSAIVVKARVKTRPIKQWTIGREVNRRMKQRFDELGIERPFPHRTIYLGADKHGEAPPLHIAVDRITQPMPPPSAGERRGDAPVEPPPPDYPELEPDDGSASDAPDRRAPLAEREAGPPMPDDRAKVSTEKSRNAREQPSS